MSEILNEFIKDLILIDEDGKVFNTTDEVTVLNDLIFIKTEYCEYLNLLLEQLLIKDFEAKSIKLSGLSMTDKRASLFFEKL